MSPKIHGWKRSPRDTVEAVCLGGVLGGITARVRGPAGVPTSCTAKTGHSKCRGEDKRAGQAGRLAPVVPHQGSGLQPTSRSCLKADNGAGATALHGATTSSVGQGRLHQVRKVSSHFQTDRPATRPKHGAATVKTDKSWAWEASEGLASWGGEMSPSPLGPPRPWSSR